MSPENHTPANHTPDDYPSTSYSTDHSTCLAMMSRLENTIRVLESENESLTRNIGALQISLDQKCQEVDNLKRTLRDIGSAPTVQVHKPESHLNYPVHATHNRAVEYDMTPGYVRLTPEQIKTVQERESVRMPRRATVQSVR